MFALKVLSRHLVLRPCCAPCCPGAQAMLSYLSFLPPQHHIMPLNRATTHTTAKRGTMAYDMYSTRSRHIWLGTTGTAAFAASMFFLQSTQPEVGCISMGSVVGLPDAGHKRFMQKAA